MPLRPSAHRRSAAWVLALALFTTLSAPAATAAPPDPVIETGTQLNQAAMAGSSSAAVDADAYFARQLALYPADPLLRAYYGSSHSRLATTTWLPWKKMGYAEDGLADLDKALSQLTTEHDAQLHRGVPVSLETRFVAASTFLSLPPMFNRKVRGDKLMADLLQTPLLERAPLPFRAAVWMRAATAAQSDGHTAEARRLLGLIIAANAPQSAAAQSALKELK